MSSRMPFWQLQQPLSRDQSYFQPDTPPSPFGFGYVGQQQIQTLDPMKDIQIGEPTSLYNVGATQVDDTMKMINDLGPTVAIPDISKVEFGAGNRDVVGDLLRIANDQPALNLTGITKEYALRKLGDWGYPTDPNALTDSEWATKLAGHASDPNPLTILGVQ